MMKTRRPKPNLRDLKALAFFTQQIFPGHADIVEGELADRRDMILATHPGQPPYQANAGRVHRDDDAGMAARAFGIGAGDAEHDQEAAARMGSSGDEPFAAGDDVVV